MELSLVPGQEPELLHGPFVVLVPGAVVAALLVERVIMPLRLFLLLDSLAVGCQFLS